MQKSVRVVRIFGIDVEVHYSWLFVFLLLAFALARQYFPMQFPGLSQVTYWALGATASLGLFLSVLFHELCHSAVARYYKLKINKITLFFFGGVAQIHEEHITPKIEFFMSIVGPLFSIGLGAMLFLILTLEPPLFINATFFYLARINIILGIFNLFPGFPLDGGRVLRSILWAITHNYEKATWYASRGGKLFGATLVVLGGISIITGNFAGGWFVLIGAFIYMLAEISFEQTVVKERLAKLKVKDVVNKKFPIVTPKTSLTLATNKFLTSITGGGVPVIANQEFKGILALEKIRMIPEAKRKKLAAKDVMVPASKIPKASLNESLHPAFMKMLAKGLSFIPVVENKKFKGVITKDQIANLIKLKA